MHLRTLLAYGALGFPLAFAALPLYVHVPRLYAETAGLSLGAVGAVLLLARLADALLDPWIGSFSDARLGRGGRRRVIALALPLLGIGLALLLSPPHSAGAGWLAATLAITFLGFSIASINYHAWGAELGASNHERTQVTAARESFALAGVVVAAALPALLAGTTDGSLAAGLRLTAGVFLPILLIAALVSWFGTPAETQAQAAATPGLSGWRAPLAALGDPIFRRLLAILLLGGIAAAIPATLVLFFVSDILQLPQWQGAFLALYFIAGAAALPFWVGLARRQGKVRAWLAAMALAIASFVWAFWLGPGDGLAFALVCMASGAALGAELAVPPALLADRLARSAATQAGSYFGIWNFVTKLTLALAAGIALPLVGLAGYEVGAGGTAPPEPGALAALAATYALLPALVKTCALALLWHWRKLIEELPARAWT